MAKVKGDFNKQVMIGEDLVEFQIVWSVDDDVTGYEVQLSDDKNISFGQGDLACELSALLMDAIQNEIEFYNEDILPAHFAFEFDFLESIFNEQDEMFLTSPEYIRNLSKIINYINVWHDKE